MPDPTPSLSVCGLVPYPLGTTPSQRFRIEQWIPHLRDEGIRVELVPFADRGLFELLHRPGRWTAKALRSGTAVLRRWLLLPAVRRHDAVLIHRAACIPGPALLERLLGVLGRPVIFDFDDAVYLLHTTGTNRRLGWLKFPGKTAAICRASTAVVVGNATLAEYARRFNPSVTVIPSSVDTTRYQPVSRRREGGPIVVGWTGSSTSQTYLELFPELLRALVERHGVELRVHSDRPPVLPGVPFVWRPWSPETEVEELSRFDIGIMPMPDTPWARGKCAMKALLYMALGIPTVCSAVGTNCEVIRHEENGFLATTTEEWLTHLGALIADPGLRTRLGQAGRRTIEKEYSMVACASRFAQVVRGAVANDRTCPGPRTDQYRSMARGVEAP
jgi:glycosyltransferase involved in cell wall biosynthesis